MNKINENNEINIQSLPNHFIIIKFFESLEIICKKTYLLLKFKIFIYLI